MGKCILILKGGANGSAILSAVGKGLSYSAVTVRVYLYLYPVLYCVVLFYGNAVLLYRLCV